MGGWSDPRRKYTFSANIDIVLNHCPLFPGQNDIDQLYRVTSILGTPTKGVFVYLTPRNVAGSRDSSGLQQDTISRDAICSI